MPHEKVLLVDDETEFTSVLAERMETRGLQVQTVDNGRDAVRKIEEETYDAVILDMLMPDMDGIETLRRLLEKNPDLQVILLTGHATLEKSVEAVKLGAMDFLEKSADLQKLLDSVKEAGNKRMLLVEKRAEEDIKKILKTKGW